MLNLTKWLPWTLYVRVWIETKSERPPRLERLVTLYVRVWIETISHITHGLTGTVTLYVRVWIET